MTAPCAELVAEVERITERRPDVVDVLSREVADLRCTLREIRDLTSEETIRALATSRLVQ